MWEIIVSVFCGDVYIGKLRTDIIVNDDIVEFFVCGIKFMVSADEISVTVSTASTNVILNANNSWYSGLMSEPLRNRDKIFNEFKFEIEATKHRIGM